MYKGQFISHKSVMKIKKKVKSQKSQFFKLFYRSCRHSEFLSKVLRKYMLSNSLFILLESNFYLGRCILGNSREIPIYNLGRNLSKIQHLTKSDHPKVCVCLGNVSKQSNVSIETSEIWVSSWDHIYKKWRLHQLSNMRFELQLKKLGKNLETG